MDTGISSTTQEFCTSSSTPRTPHSPSQPAGALGSMASPRTAACGASVVRPVTSRTWQALAAEEAARPHEAAVRRVSVYTNDLYSHATDGDQAGPSSRAASPLYQPASSRPGTPTPKAVERLQQQRTATPTRLAAAHSPRHAEEQQAASRPAAASPRGHEEGAARRSVARADPMLRPSTAPIHAFTMPFRASAISMSPLLQPQPLGQGASCRPGMAGSSALAADSTRVRKQLLHNFAAAVPASSAGSGDSPGGQLYGSPSSPARATQGGGSSSSRDGGDRPSTPSFQRIAMGPRPATAMAGPPELQVATNFTIKAAYNGAALQHAQPQHSAHAQRPADGPAGAYPQPPSTAPAQSATQGFKALAPLNALAKPQPGSLASFGISAAAFVAAAPKGVDSKGEVPVPLQASMLASASLSSKADLRRFLLSPGPADKPLCCKVVRSRAGLLRGSPQYALLVEQEGGKTGTFLVAARKRKGGPGGASYVLSVDQHDISRQSTSYVGKLRSNFLGTEFAFCDGGVKGGAGESPRCELASALYQTNVLGTKGPRKMTVLIPRLKAGGQQPQQLSPKGDGDTLLSQYKAYNLSSCVVLRNKPPRWNQAMGAYCLNFGGRVTQASVKNFQLVSVDNMERTILQFGKVADDVFTLDYAYPMTALQAFAICLSSFASKLACE